MTELEIFNMIDNEVEKLKNTYSLCQLHNNVIQDRISVLTNTKLTLNDLIKRSLT